MRFNQYSIFEILFDRARVDRARASNNINAFIISLYVFMLNQVAEYFVIKLSGNAYSSLCSWDCGWYGSIIDKGYDIEPHGHEKGDAANWAFFPLFPIFSILIKNIFFLTDQEGLVVSGKLCFLLAIFAFIKFSKAYDEHISPFMAGFVVAFNPYSIYGNTGYTEPMFLLFSCISFYFLKNNRPILSGFAGSLLGSIRLTGLFFAISYFMHYFYLVSKKAVTFDKLKVIAIGLAIIPLGLSLFVLYLYFLTGDGLAFIHIQKSWGRTIQNPIAVFVNGFYGTDVEMYWSFIVLLAYSLVAVLILHKNYALATFSILAITVPLSTGLVSMPRYVFWQAPILLAVCQVLNKLNKRFSWLLLPISYIGLVWMYLLWFNHRNVVV